MKVYRNVEVNGSTQQQVIFDIAEATYSGTDMGERKITATIKHQTIIDFQIGDYVKLDMADLLGGHAVESFYLFNLPTIKKTARAGSVGDAFEHNVTFYPAQFELNITQMRDILNQNSTAEITAENFIYTGYDEFSFFGGAHTLMRRILYVLQDRFGTSGTAGIDYWDYKIAESVDEDINTSLEKCQFDFSHNSVWEALCKLNEEDGINTDFFIVGRMIYVGFKRPNIVGVDGSNVLQEEPFLFKYGKTSHLPIGTNYGNLFSITKSIGNTSPITRLYAYGDSKNLNRFYASDRLRSGRYVSKLMLPSFNNDGKTDWIDSVDGIKKFGIREESQSFPEIYPSLRYVTYGDLRSIQYVIMIENGGGLGKAGKIDLTVPIARIQCYRVNYDNDGVAKLVRSYPKDKLAVFIHATGKVVKCVLYPSQEEQSAADFGHLPKEGTSLDNAKVIVGSCFCVHDDGYNDYLSTQYTTRTNWFANPDKVTDAKKKREIELHQIQYTDDYWVTDAFLFDNNAPYDEQRVFSREPYSVYCYPHINKKYNNGSEESDNLSVNEIVAVEPVTIVDTDLNKENGKGQKTFVIYMRDFGFMINEQAYSGQYQWIVNGEFKINFLDGYMAGLDFTVSAKGDGVIPAYKNGKFNSDWYVGVDSAIAKEALNNGAFWRIICNRNTDNEYSYMPNAMLNPKKGDHVVFLNIYMPDLYILSAEKRLLIEAQKYLNEHDNGDITYSLELDKVRLAQVPAFGLQMREGAVMRIVDDDLKIYTENEETFLYSNSNGLLSEIDLSSQPTITRKVTDIKVPFRNFEFGYIHIAELDLLYDYKYILVGIFVRNGKETIDAEILDIKKSDNGLCLVTYKMPQLVFNRHAVFYVGYTIKDTDLLTISGILAFKQIFEFKPNKHYTIEVGIIQGSVDANSLILTSGIDRLSSVYYPNSIITRENLYDGTEKITFEFDTSSAFNGKNPYYIALDFENSTTQRVSARLLSVKESNTGEVGEYANFVDLTIDSLNIKISDAVNEYSVGSGTSSNGTSTSSKGSSSKEITATVKEKRLATAWQAMSNEIRDTSIVSSQNTKTNEQLANIARRNYRELESLKDNIFDPDGTINDVFLQTMLLQVGANSMNYTLDNTKVFNGTYRNVEFVKNANDVWSIHFGRDILRHYVYTEGSQMGTWSIPQSDTIELDGDTVYYISLKCERNGSSGQWIVDTIQHKVDEEDNYWYFNYGIIGAVDGTHRNLTETRGNVFVYGDNINAGKIMTSDGNSYFDLTGNSFKLGDQLEYKDGVLTLKGVNDGSVDSILTRLGLTEKTANSANYVNLYADGDLSFNYTATSFPIHKGLIQGLPEGTYKTVITSESNGKDGSVAFDGFENSCLVWFKAGAGDGYDVNDVLQVHKDEILAFSNWGDDITVDEPTDVVVYTCTKDVIQNILNNNLYPEFPASGTWTINGIQIIGLVSTAISRTESTAKDALATANVAQDSIDNMQVGGENLYTGDNPLTMAASTSNYNYVILVKNLQNGEQYIFSCGKSVVKAGSTGKYAVLLYDFNAPSSTQARKLAVGTTRIEQAFTIPYTGTWSMLIYSGVSGSTAGISMEFTDIMVQKGNRATAYQTAVGFLGKAIKDGSTEITGGLLMTNVLMLKDENSKVTAGMSGMTGTTDNPEDLLLWCGSTYSEALNVLRGLVKKTLPVLLTKKGAGSNIGCLKIMPDNKTVMVTSNQSDALNVIITSETAQYVSDYIYTSYYYSYQKWSFEEIENSNPQTKTLLSLNFLPNQNLELNIDNICFQTSRAGFDNFSTITFKVQLKIGNSITNIQLQASNAILYYYNNNGKYVKHCRADILFDSFTANANNNNDDTYIAVRQNQCTPLDGKTLASNRIYYIKYNPAFGSISSSDNSSLDENGVRGLSVSDYQISGDGVIQLVASDIVAQGSSTATCSLDRLTLCSSKGLCIISSDGITIQKGNGRFIANVTDKLDIVMNGLPTENNPSAENHLYIKKATNGEKTLMLSHITD